MQVHLDSETTHVITMKLSETEMNLLDIALRTITNEANGSALLNDEMRNILRELYMNI